MEVRKRINAKQTAAGKWQLDATVEHVEEVGVAPVILADQLAALIAETERVFTAAGREFVSGK